MSSLNYIRPQSIIRSHRQVVENEPEGNINAFLVGPVFHTQLDLDKSAAVVPEASAATVVPYTGIPEHAVVDKDSVKVVGQDLQLLLGKWESGGSSSNVFRAKSTSEPNKVRLSLRSGPQTGQAVRGSARAAELEGRDMQIGDLMSVDGAVRTVTGFERELIPSTFGSDGVNEEAENAPANPVNSTASVTSVSIPSAWSSVSGDASSWSQLDTGVRYGDKYADRYTAEVVVGGGEASNNTAAVRFKVSSASGLYSDPSVGGVIYDTSDYKVTILGVDLVMDLGLSEFVVGQKFSFTVEGNYARLVPGTDIVLGGTYTGSRDTTYQITIVEGNPDGGGYDGTKVRISDTAGVDSAEILTINANTTYPLGTQGLTFRFNDASMPVQAALRTGDVYTTNAVAASATGVESIVVLNGAVPGSEAWTPGTTPIVDSEHRYRFTGNINPRGFGAPTLTWEAGEALEGVTVIENPRLFVNGRDPGSEWCPVVAGVGTYKSTYRALLPASASEPIRKISSREDIERWYGPITPENDLAFAAELAREASFNKGFYALAVSSDDVEGYEKALRQASNSNTLYAVTPLSTDGEVLDAVRAHVQYCRGETVKRWRAGYIPVDNPGEYGVLTTLAGGSSYLAIVASAGAGNTRVTASNADFVAAGVQPGDLFRINYSTDVWGDVTYEEYVVSTVVGPNELVLRTGPTLPVVVASKFELWKPDTGASQAEWMRNFAQARSSDFMTYVWCDSPLMAVGDELIPLESKFLAAYVAGLRCAAPYQQGLTRTEVPVIAAAPLMYTKYTQEELDVAASGGVFIVTQERSEGPVFIRHQLTSEMSKGILYYEDSVRVNHDEILYGIDATVNQFIGKYNGVRVAVSAIHDAVWNTLYERTLTDLTLEEVGPQIVYIKPGTLKVVMQPETGRIKVSVVLGLPTPINVIEVDLFHEVAVDDTEIIP